MPSFEIVYPIIKENEGGWFCDPVAPEGDTLFGMTRRDWPHMGAWRIVEKYREGRKLDLSRLSELELAACHADAKTCARIGYYNRLKCDWMLNQSFVNMVCDAAFLNGPVTTGRFIQRGLNKMNRSKSRFPQYPNMKKDGGIGRVTLGALHLVGYRGELNRLFALVKSYRIVWYSILMEREEEREKWQGWIDRADTFYFVDEPFPYSGLIAA